MSKKNESQEKEPEYIRVFCKEKYLHDRKALYISTENHKKIKQIADLFKYRHLTISSLVDNILSHHIHKHRKFLNEQVEQEDNTLFPGNEN